MRRLFIISVISLLVGTKESQADVSLVKASFVDHSSVYEKNIPELVAEGQYFKALSAFYNSTSELKLADKLAAAKSAWALSNPSKARELWQEVLADKELKGEERSRICLSLAMLESQEANYEEARSLAEREAHNLSASELRAQFWLLIAESLKEQKAFSVAEGYYKKAIAEGNEKIKFEANYLLGEVQYRLGLIDDSRYSFTQVALGSEYAFTAIKRLIEIDYAQKNYQGVLNWISEAKENFPVQIKDAQTSYFYISSLVELGNIDHARRELESFKINNSENNPWYLLSLASIEAKAVSLLEGEK